MDKAIKCPECGFSNFIKNHHILFNLFTFVKFSEDGEVLEEREVDPDFEEADSVCQVDSYRCSTCGLEITDEDGGAFPEPEEIVKFFRTIGEDDQADPG